MGWMAQRMPRSRYSHFGYHIAASPACAQVYAAKLSSTITDLLAGRWPELRGHLKPASKSWREVKTFGLLVLPIAGHRFGRGHD